MATEGATSGDGRDVAELLEGALGRALPDQTSTPRSTVDRPVLDRSPRWQQGGADRPIKPSARRDCFVTTR